MPDTFVKIATVTVGAGGAANIEFSSIPSTYTDLTILLSGRTSYTGTVYRFGTIQFNGVSTNLSTRNLYASSNTTPASDTATEIYFWNNSASSTTSTFNNAQFYIPNYAGSTNKSLSIDTVAENNGTSWLGGLVAGLWSNTSAITSIQLVSNGGNFVQYSTATLYGISKS